MDKLNSWIFVVIFLPFTNSLAAHHLHRIAQFNDCSPPTNMTSEQSYVLSCLKCAMLCDRHDECETLFVKKMPAMCLCKFSNHTVVNLEGAVIYSAGFKAYNLDKTESAFTGPNGTTQSIPMATNQANSTTTSITQASSQKSVTQSSTTGDITVADTAATELTTKSSTTQASTQHIMTQPSTTLDITETAATEHSTKTQESPTTLNMATNTSSTEATSTLGLRSLRTGLQIQSTTISSAPDSAEDPETTEEDDADVETDPPSDVDKTDAPDVEDYK